MSRWFLLPTVVLTGVFCACAPAALAADAKPTLPDATKEDPVEQEFKKLMADDDAAQEEVDRWIKENDTFAQAGAGARPAMLQSRIRGRLGSVRKGYEDFLKRHPNHAQAHLAFGSFLNDLEEEEDAANHWDRARELNPDDPAAWNNLANHYGHFGPVAKAFAYYEKAIALKTNEPVYYQNLATTTYLFRKDAMDYFKCDETGVFEKSLAFYRTALALDPMNFLLATDYAESFYGIKPMRTNDALKAWGAALAIARDEIEREGVYIHLARIKLNAARFEEARQHLNAITNTMYTSLKERLLKNLAEKESPPVTATNEPPAANAKP